MPEKKTSPDQPADDEVLLGGLGLGGGDVDTSVTPTGAASHRKGAPTSDAAEMPPPSDDDTLVLPSTAIAALRKSGGLRFSSREVVVFRDGRVSYRALAPQPEPRRRSVRILSSAEMGELRRLIRACLLQPRPPARSSPDAFVSEVATRSGRTVRQAELTPVAMDASEAALADFLTKLFPAQT